MADTITTVILADLTYDEEVQFLVRQLGMPEDMAREQASIGRPADQLPPMEVVSESEA